MGVTKQAKKVTVKFQRVAETEPLPGFVEYWLEQDRLGSCELCTEPCVDKNTKCTTYATHEQAYLAGEESEDPSGLEIRAFARGKEVRQPEVDRLMEELQAATASQRTCMWRQDNDGCWHSGCDKTWALNDGTPGENGMKFCVFCGKKLGEYCQKIDAKIDHLEGELEAERSGTNWHDGYVIVCKERDRLKEELEGVRKARTILRIEKQTLHYENEDLLADLKEYVKINDILNASNEKLTAELEECQREVAAEIKIEVALREEIFDLRAELENWK